MGCLAFDVTTWLWWGCPTSQTLTGSDGDQTPTCQCRHEGIVQDERPCGQHLFTWDEWRAVAKMPLEGEAA